LTTSRSCWLMTSDILCTVKH